MNTLKQKRTLFSQIAIFGLLAVGVTSIVVSAFYASSFLAIFGLAMVFWGVILLYITPVKHVPLALLNASANANDNNIERILSEFNLTEKGIYLPPRNLKNIEFNLIFVPQTSKTPLPTSEEATETLFSNKKNGVILTPPGLALSRLFELEFGSSFTKTDFAHLQQTFPKLLVDNLEIAENIEIQMHEDIITIEITGSILNAVCQETNNQPKTHAQVGCLLTSAFACILAKATGKPITIQSETRNIETKTTVIKYSIEEE